MRTSSVSRRRVGVTTASSARSSTSSISPRIRPGSPLWHPKGMVIWNALEDLRRRENARRGYVEVKTPLLYDVETYITSGHYDNYRENMFFVETHEGEKPLALKPMNCPGHMLLFGERLRSYRELPIRYAESSPLHRDERGGTLHGLLRVKHITQDDAHVFCHGGADPGARSHGDGRLRALPVRPFRPDAARRALHSAGATARHGRAMGPRGDSARDRLEAARHGVRGERGEGTFYGPKIDLHMDDSLGRSWQMGTIQLDYQMPVALRAELLRRGQRASTIRSSSTGRSRVAGALRRHPDRALRGRVPVWLAPVQIRIIPVGQDHREAAQALEDELAGYRVEIDERDETVGKRIRDAEVEKVPYVIVYGDKESDVSSLAGAAHAAAGRAKYISLRSLERDLRGARSSGGALLRHLRVAL